MPIVIRSLEIALPFFYFATIWIYARSFFSNIKLARTLERPLLSSTLIVHACYLIIFAADRHHLPITSIPEVLSFLAFTIGVVYVYIELRTKDSSTGYFILNLPFFFQLFSTIFSKADTLTPQILQSGLLELHVCSALFGYAAITISATYGLLYLMLYHNIKSNHFGVIYKRLPNLEMLTQMSFTATVFGFIFLTLAIIIGIVWLPRAVNNFSYSDPKLVSTIANWLVYSVGLTAKTIGRWEGRKTVLISILGFLIAIFSMTFINLFLSGFHKFY